MATPEFIAAIQHALSRQLAGDLDAAETTYRSILQVDPNQADTSYLLGQLCREAGRLDEAAQWLAHAAENAPDNLVFRLGNAELLLEKQQPQQAIAIYQQVLAQQPETPEALFGLGCALIDLRDFDSALTALQAAIILAPSHPPSWAALGELALRRGDHVEAERCFRAARANGLDSAEVANNLGICLNALNRHDEAVMEFGNALRLKPGYPEAAMNLGNALRERGDVEGARRSYQHVLTRRPADSLRIRMATMLPPVYGSREEMLEYRARYEANLDELLEEPLARGDPIADGGLNNFYLCYQGFNDRDLQIKLARLYRKVIGPAEPRGPTRQRGTRIRIGFVSAFFTDHTIGHLNRGIIAGLDRKRFEVFVFSVGAHQDHVARAIAAAADHYHAFNDRRLPDAEALIASCGLDVLFYPDIGMEPFTYFLAFSRLAPVQCVTWGHPVTTGIDTVDYFLSSIHQESGASAAHYSEQLVCLNSIPAYYDPPEHHALGRDRVSFGLSSAAHIYFCPQSLFKFHPDFDALISAILETDAEGELLIPEGHRQQWSENLRTRFQRTMPQVENRIRFLPRQSYEDYLQLMQLTDAVLDPLHFGGGKTTLDGLSLGVPIVTLPGEFMRSRATAASYRQMALEHNIAANAADYVHKIVLLAREPEWRQVVHLELLARRHLLAQRIDMVRALEDFLIAAVESGE